VLRGADYWFTAHIEGGIDNYGKTSQFFETLNHLVEEGVGFTVDCLDSG